jgi:hypothetical protein
MQKVAMILSSTVHFCVRVGGVSAHGGDLTRWRVGLVLTLHTGTQFPKSDGGFILPSSPISAMTVSK